LLSNMNWKIDASEIHISAHGMDASKMSLNAPLLEVCYEIFIPFVPFLMCWETTVVFSIVH